MSERTSKPTVLPPVYDASILDMPQSKNQAAIIYYQRPFKNVTTAGKTTPSLSPEPKTNGKVKLVSAAKVIEIPVLGTKFYLIRDGALDTVTFVETVASKWRVSRGRKHLCEILWPDKLSTTPLEAYRKWLSVCFNDFNEAVEESTAANAKMLREHSKFLEAVRLVRKAKADSLKKRA